MEVICVVEKCEREPYRRDMCSMHYQRMRKHGDPLAGNARFSDPEESFAARAKLDSGTGCMIWTGSKGSNGYGQIMVAGITTPAHRYAWERKRGAIPDGMLVDHKCFRRDCVEISHLRLADAFQNQQNRAGAMPHARSGARNVYQQRSGAYKVLVKRRGITHRGGTYRSLDEAVKAAAALRKQLFGDFAGRG